MPNIGTREDLSVLRFRKGGSTQYFTCGILGTAGMVFDTTLNYLYAIPFFVSKTEKFDRIAINVLIVGTGTKARLGIYADDGAVAPGRLVLDAGEVAVNAVAVVQIIISQELIGGQLYWLAVTCNGTSELRGLLPNSLYSVVMGVTSTLGLDWSIWYYRSDFAYAVLPDPFGTPTFGVALTVPGIYLRKV